MTRFLVSLGLISAALAAPASAQVEESRTRTVQAGDLDLATPNGIARLDRRIATAVTAVCGQVQGDREMAGSILRCRAAAFAGAAAQREYALNPAGGRRNLRIAVTR